MNKEFFYLNLEIECSNEYCSWIHTMVQTRFVKLFHIAKYKCQKMVGAYHARKVQLFFTIAMVFVSTESSFIF